jgi:hypothetical protein
VLWASSCLAGRARKENPEEIDGKVRTGSPGLSSFWSSMVGWWPGPAATSPGETEGSPCVTPPVARTEPKISVAENSAGKLARCIRGSSGKRVPQAVSAACALMSMRTMHKARGWY